MEYTIFWRFCSLDILPNGPRLLNAYNKVSKKKKQKMKNNKKEKKRVYFTLSFIYEPEHEKTTKWPTRQAMNHISLCIHPVWS